MDAVVATLVLCSIADVQQALKEIRRVLKPVSLDMPYMNLDIPHMRIAIMGPIHIHTKHSSF